MRRPYIAANWKMMKNLAETEEFINSFIPLVAGISDVDILIAPPFTSLSIASHLLLPTNIKLGAQNMHYEENGAYTGEISADMLLFAGCSTVIIGHSERRQYFNETDEIVNKKIKTAKKKGLEVILCVGESLEERESGRTFGVLDKQLAGSLKDISMDGVTVAYEPIWAIGTGRTATPEIANETHGYIREWLNKNKGNAGSVRIQYGGSVKPENISELMAQSEIDGALVGGASLKPESFANIIKGAKK
ncbi:MAG: triose-phosphate isomerase [Nitrospirae bacterium]|nr:triose-phosphate isomerase [Nitrospirota bacterium]